LQEIVTIAHKRSSFEVLELKMPTLKQFYRIARSLPSNDRVPYAFEKRIIGPEGFDAPGHIHDPSYGWAGARQAMRVGCTTRS
jgi:hypothetical protein